MKLTKAKLQQIIKEELLQEDEDDFEGAIDNAWEAMLNGSEYYIGLYGSKNNPNDFIEQHVLSDIGEKVKQVLREELEQYREYFR